MTRRTLALVVLVLVSGCLGLGTGGEGTPSPADEPETPTQTRTSTATATPTDTATPPVEERIPAGWSEAGVRDVNAALEAHYRAVLTGPSATVTYRNSVVGTDSDRANTALDVALDPGSERMYAQITTATGGQEVFYADGTLTQYDPENDTVRESQDAQYPVVVQSADLRVLRSQLLLYKLTLNETGTAQAETGALVYDVAGVYENTTSRTFGSTESGQGQVILATDGRVLAVETTVTYTEATVRYRYAQANLGSTEVSRPDWRET